jgi:hypothetical protein
VTYINVIDYGGGASRPLSNATSPKRTRSHRRT